MHGGQGRGRVPRGLHVDDPPRARRRRRPDRAVELPADDGRVEDRPGAGHRQHRRAQARADDAGLDVRWPSWPPRSCPRACSTSCCGGDDAGKALVAHDGVDMVSHHRLGRGRQGRGEARRRLAQARAPRAGRQGAGRRLRRRRPRAVVERSPASATTTPARTARPRRACSSAPRSTTTSSPASPSRPRATSWATRIARHDARPAQQRGPARARRGLPGAQAGARRGRHRRQRARPARLLPRADGRRQPAARTTR